MKECIVNHTESNNSSDDDDDDDDEIRLSVDTLAALNEFYAEQQKDRQPRVSSDVEQNTAVTFQENWQLSQFWYDENTADALSKEAIRLCANGIGRIACISCPTIYKRLREIKPDSCIAKLFEYDTRFSIYGQDFVFYDYNEPLKVLVPNFQNAFDIVIADPPFLSEECLMKTTLTIKALAKDKIILCTGAVMMALATKLMNLHVCEFIPKHARNLGNEFKCYANYNFDEHVKQLRLK